MRDVKSEQSADTYVYNTPAALCLSAGRPLCTVYVWLCATAVRVESVLARLPARRSQRTRALAVA